MKTSLLITGLCLAALVQGCGTKPADTAADTASVKLDQPTVVETACGQCQLGLKEEKGCTLAIRYEGTGYFVDGFKLADLGDPHAADGLCSKVHKAKVTGQVADGRFVASAFELIPAEQP